MHAAERRRKSPVKGGGGTTEDGEIVRKSRRHWRVLGRRIRETSSMPRESHSSMLATLSAEFDLHGRFVYARQACILEKMPLGEINLLALLAKVLDTKGGGGVCLRNVDSFV